MFLPGFIGGGAVVLKFQLYLKVTIFVCVKFGAISWQFDNANKSKFESKIFIHIGLCDKCNYDHLLFITFRLCLLDFKINTVFFS